MKCEGGQAECTHGFPSVLIIYQEKQASSKEALEIMYSCSKIKWTVFMKMSMSLLATFKQRHLLVR